MGMVNSLSTLTYMYKYMCEVLINMHAFGRVPREKATTCTKPGAIRYQFGNIKGSFYSVIGWEKCCLSRTQHAQSTHTHVTGSENRGLDYQLNSMSPVYSMIS